MRRTLVVAAALLAGLVSVAQADKKKELMPRYLKQTLDCMKEGNVEMATCKEMTQDGVDRTAEKFTPCRCVIACVAKKAKVMNDAGDVDLPTFTAIVDEFEIPEWTEEWKRVQPLCEPSIKGKKDCVLGYDFFICGYEKSEIFRDVIKKFSGMMS